MLGCPITTTSSVSLHSDSKNTYYPSKFNVNDAFSQQYTQRDMCRSSIKKHCLQGRGLQLLGEDGKDCLARYQEQLSDGQIRGWCD